MSVANAGLSVVCCLLSVLRKARGRAGGSENGRMLRCEPTRVHDMPIERERQRRKEQKSKQVQRTVVQVVRLIVSEWPKIRCVDMSSCGDDVNEEGGFCLS